GQTLGLGQAGDVGPASVTARALAKVESGLITDSHGFEAVRFDRVFVLDGSPNGWDVSVTGFLRGLLGFQAFALVNPRAAVSVLAAIKGTDDIISPIVSDHVALTTAGVRTDSLGQFVVSVPDDRYNFFGSLSVDTSIDALLLGAAGFAESDFFSGVR